MTEGAPPHTDPVEALSGRGKFRPLWLAIKAAISLGLIAAVFWKLDFATVREKSRQLSGALIVSVVSMFLAQFYLAAWRWWVILRHHRLGIRLPAALRYSLIGAFFNQLLPSSIGGDVARAWYVYRAGHGKRISVITVISDRIYGMLALACLALAFFPVLIGFSLSLKALIVIAVTIAGASSALVAAFWLDRLPRWMHRWSLIRHLGALSEATRAVTADKRALAPLIGLSFLIHAITILASVALLEAVAPQVQLLLCAALIPVIMLMAMVPVSIAGWGVREGVMIYGLGLANVPAEAALIVSVLIGLSLAAVGALGGVTWLFQTDRKEPRPVG